MAYDEGLAERIHELVDEISGLTSKKMFGGLGFIIDGNMAVGVSGDKLIVRVRPDAHDKTLRQPHTNSFGPAGREMRGWATIDAEGIAEDSDLQSWVDKGVAFAHSLPAK